MGIIISRLRGRRNRQSSLHNVSLPNHNLKINKLIGEGGFANVYLVTDKDTNEQFALKMFTCMEDEQRITFAKTEINTLKKFSGKSPHIIELIDTDDLQCVLLPFYQNGTIQSIIDNERERRGLQPYIPIPGMFQRNSILRIISDVCIALEFFHNHNPPLAHRDISPANILIKEDDTNILRGVIMDFGSTANARPSVETYSDCVALQELAESTCSALYRAPELYDVNSHTLVDERSDIWVCIFYCFSVCKIFFIKI